MDPVFQIRSDIKKGISVKVVLIIAGAILLFLFFLGALGGYYSGLELLERGNTKIMHALLTLGIGSIILLLTLYWGFIPHRLVADDDSVICKHGMRKKQIPWGEIRGIELVGLNSKDEKSPWAVIIEGPRYNLVCSTEFAKIDLQEFSDIANKKAEVLDFRVIKAS